MTDPISQQHMLLALGIFGASILQSASGIGFGVVAGPLIMMTTNSSAAIQVSILLSFAISLLLAPSALRAVERPLLMRLVVGTFVGAPVGIAAFVMLSLSVLKLLAAVITVFNLLSMLGWLSWKSPASKTGQQLIVGALSGALSTGLAMPGPIVAAHLGSTDRPKEAVRSATLSLFLCSYPIAYLAQALVATPSIVALNLTLHLLPACILGVPVGAWLGKQISDVVFHWIGITVMIATAVALLVMI